MIRNFIVSKLYTFADKIGSIQLSSVRDERHIKEWSHSTAFKKALFGLLCVGLVMLLPQKAQIFGIVGAVAIVFLVNRPKVLLYVCLLYLTFRYFYCLDLNYNPVTAYTSFFSPWRFRSDEAIFVRHADKWVVMALLICLLNIYLFRKRKFNAIFRQLSMVKAFWFFILVVIVSSVANGITAEQSFFFLQLYLRPMLFMLLFVQVKWSEVELNNFFLFIFILILPMQVIFSMIENVPKILRFQFIFVDNFTGTFCFPFSFLSVQLLLYSFFYYLSRFLLKMKKKNIFAMIFIIACIFSASSGFQTLMFFIAASIFLIWMGLSSGGFYLRSKFSRLLSFTGLAFLGGAIIFIYTNPDILTPLGQGGYYTHAVKKYSDMGFHNMPKFHIYSVSFDLVLDGTINPVWGNGPTNFLSGASVKYGNALLSEYGTSGFFTRKKGVTGMPSYVENDIVGLAGEVGIIGFLIYVFMYISPMLFIKRNMRLLSGTKWHSVAITSIASTLFLLVFAVGFVVLGNYLMPVYPVLLMAISIKVIEIRNVESTQLRKTK